MPEPDPYSRCNAPSYIRRPGRTKAGNLRPFYLCNRPAWHEGPHRHNDPRTFAKLAEWEASDAGQA